MKNRRSVGSPSATVRNGEHGVTIVETLIAILILTIGVLGTMSLLALAGTQNWNQDRATRVTEYAADKMEQLLALNFGDAASNTTVYPTGSSGGTGLGGSMAGSTTVGGVTAGSSVSQYVDYVDSVGSVQSTSTNANYIRQWSISTNALGDLKTITVVTRALILSANGPAAPSTTLVSRKAQ